MGFGQGQGTQQLQGVTHQETVGEAQTGGCGASGPADGVRVGAGVLIDRGLQTGGVGAGEIELVDLGVDEHLPRRHVDLAQQILDLRPLLRGTAHEDGVVEWIGYDAGAPCNPALSHA